MSLLAPLSGEARKAVGAFYTPPDIVGFLCDWAIRSAGDRILEPSAGDGTFVMHAISRLRVLGARNPGRNVHAIELRDAEARGVSALAPESDVRSGDFFEVGPEDLPPMRVVIGNPPFIRFHRFKGKPRDLGRSRATAQDVELSGLAASWAHFLVHASAFLDPQIGRLALVLPAELLHADYAQPVRNFLIRRFASVTIVAFDKRAFHPALVDAVLLLCDNDGPKGLHVWRLTEASQLSVANLTGSEGFVRSGDRWSSALHQDGARLYGRLLEQDRYCRLGTVASVDIGLVTGANSFFVLTDQQKVEHRLPEDVVTKIVERGRDLTGIVVQEAETRLLFDLGRTPGRLGFPAVEAYLAEGVTAHVDQGYKASRRKPWWQVPKPRAIPDLLLGYMHSGSPRLLANPKHFWSTNLVHGVKLHDPMRAFALAAASLSSATAFSAEVEGRVYGGGVLKLEPSDAERLLVPSLTPGEALALEAKVELLDRLVRAGDRETASRIVDHLLGIAHDENLGAVTAFQQRRRSLSQPSKAR